MSPPTSSSPRRGRMKIAVVGTGGVGGYYGALLARAGHDVSFVARGSHLRAIQDQGLQVESPFGDFQIKPARATDDPAQVGMVDLVLFCTKTYSTDEAADQARPLVGPSTTVLSLQNGVDAAERIGSTLGSEHIIAGATWLSSIIAAPGVIRQLSDARRVVIGEPDGRITARVQAAYDAFNGTGVTAELSPNIMGVLWEKLVFIAAIAGFGSLTRLPVGAYRAVPETRTWVLRLMQETVAVAHSHGVKLEGDAAHKALAYLDNARPSIKASMQLDVEAGRPSELDSLIGVIGRKGRQRGVPTPVADMIYALLLPGETLAREALGPAGQVPTPTIPS